MLIFVTIRQTECFWFLLWNKSDEPPQSPLWWEPARADLDQAPWGQPCRPEDPGWAAGRRNTCWFHTFTSDFYCFKPSKSKHPLMLIDQKCCFERHKRHFLNSAAAASHGGHLGFQACSGFLWIPAFLQEFRVILLWCQLQCQLSLLYFYKQNI